MATSNQPSTHQSSFNVSSFLDTTRPNLARIFDYFGGGSTHFEPDRRAADEMLAQFPPLKKWVKLRKAFTFEAIQALHKQGFDQFLDLGSGMPSNDSPDQLVPTAHFVYSDINPIAVSYGVSLFSDKEHVTYTFGDAGNISTLLKSTEVTAILDTSKKTAIGLNNILVFLPPEKASETAHKLYEWAPVGSQMFVFLQVKRDDLQDKTDFEAFEGKLAAARFPIRFNSLQDLLKRLEPWRVKELVPVLDFMRLPDTFLDGSDGVDVGLQFLALFVIKEAI